MEEERKMSAGEVIFAAIALTVVSITLFIHAHFEKVWPWILVFAGAIFLFVVVFVVATWQSTRDLKLRLPWDKSVRLDKKIVAKQKALFAISQGRPIEELTPDERERYKMQNDLHQDGIKKFKEKYTK